MIDENEKLPPGIPDMTRFLPQLREMLRKDSRGAIDDMLQILRECGVLYHLEQSSSVDKEMAKDTHYRHHLDRTIRGGMAEFLHREGVVKCAEEPDTFADPMRPMTRIRMRIEVVGAEYTDFIIPNQRRKAHGQ